MKGASCAFLHDPGASGHGAGVANDDKYNDNDNNSNVNSKYEHYDNIIHD